MMSEEEMQAMAEGIYSSDGLTPSEKLVLLRICFTVEADGKATPTRKSLAHYTGLSESRISVLITSLREKGFLRVERIVANRNRYEITLPNAISFE
jgi:DNA-binding MarR family transcriptional regulator